MFLLVESIIPQYAKINKKKNRLGGRFKLTKYTTDILSGLFGSTLNQFLLVNFEAVL